MNSTIATVLGVLAEDTQKILYRPRWKAITGGVTGSILLQQIFYRWYNGGRKPFYKFKEPCQHGLYIPGDSWTEELGFSRREFDTALKKIGTRQSKKTMKTHVFPVEYWITAARVTYYTIHLENFWNLLSQIYQQSDENDDYSIKAQSHFSKRTNEPIDQDHDSGSTKSTNGAVDPTKNFSEKNMEILWEKILKLLEPQISDERKFNGWFRSASLLAVTETTCTICVTDDIHLGWLKNYEYLFTDALRELLGRKIKIQFEVKL